MEYLVQMLRRSDSPSMLMPGVASSGSSCSALRAAKTAR